MVPCFFFIYFYLNFKKWKGKKIHFNFSRPYSLILLFFLPKLGAKFELMLHHGELKTGSLSAFYKLVIDKFDTVYILSDAQEGFYKKLEVNASRIVRISSYVKPAIDISNIHIKVKNEVDTFFSN